MGILDFYKNNFPPKPTLTEKELPSQAGKVFIVTGSSSGVGKRLAQILYSHDAKVYVAARSAEKSTKAIEDIKSQFPESKGEFIFLHLDLGDLTTIKKSAEDFLSKEDRLDVLWNNAGVMIPPQGSKTTQGYELQIGTNNLAPFLFTQLLTPILAKTPKQLQKITIRWIRQRGTNTESAKRVTGIMPLNMPSDIKPMGSLALHSIPAIFGSILYDPIYGAYTELYAGLSPDVTLEKTGSWLQPWGRIVSIRADLQKGTKSEAEGGTGIAEKFWAWTEEQVKSYM